MNKELKKDYKFISEFQFKKKQIEDIKEQGRNDAIEIIKEMKNPYPLDLFPKIELDKGQSNGIDEFLRRVYGFSLDRLSAELMRRARENVKQELLNSLGEKC